jgi:hypothetical protein
LLLLLLPPVDTLTVGLSPVGVSPVHCSRRLQLSILSCAASARQPLARYRVGLPA